MPELSAEERKMSFVEQVLGYDKESARKEAARCLECKLCEEACPAHLKISDYIRAIYEDKPVNSLKTIFEDNPIPAICGRICMKHCETACSLSIRGEPVAIRWLKRYVADSILDYKTALELSPAQASGKRVAIIGAGPSGLALAYFITLKGHHAVVFDAFPGGGGMVRIGPPAYRLPLESIDKDVNHMASLGVEFRFNTRVGTDISFEDIMKQYDAVYLAIGTSQSRSTKVKNADKCMLALDFLRKSKLEGGVAVGKNIVVIGGGNVAMDVARTALRLQKIQHPDTPTETKTVCLENWDIMPASEDEIRESREEGIAFNPAWGPKEVRLDDNGNIAGLLCMKVKSVFDDQGRFSPSFYEGQEMFLEADTIIEAIGQAPDFSFIPQNLMSTLEFTPRRKVKVDENGQTTITRVFAGGDIVNINLDAVTAIADAKVAAEGIGKIFSKKTSG
jgi:glutamate synthase (NADPH/NADH) small chain